MLPFEAPLLLACVASVCPSEDFQFSASAKFVWGGRGGVPFSSSTLAQIFALAPILTRPKIEKSRIHGNACYALSSNRLWTGLGDSSPSGWPLQKATSICCALTLTVMSSLHRSFLGNWSEWGAWGDCDKSCGNGTKLRGRTCLGPVPCEGNRTSHGTCNTEPCAGKSACRYFERHLFAVHRWHRKIKVWFTCTAQA